MGGDPINFHDPFGLCTDEKSGEWRRCSVTVSPEGVGRGTRLEDLDARVLALLQQLADEADVDLGVNFTTNGKHSDPGHALGTAVDIGYLNGRDIGQGAVTHPGMLELSRHVQAVAGRIGSLKSSPETGHSGNLGPSGKWFGASGPQRINDASTRLGHMNHIHLSYVFP